MIESVPISGIPSNQDHLRQINEGTRHWGTSIPIIAFTEWARKS